MDVALLVHVELKAFAGRGGVRVLRNLENIVVIAGEQVRPEFVDGQFEGITLLADLNKAVTRVLVIPDVIF